LLIGRKRGELAMTFVYCLLAGFLGAVSAVAVLLLLFWVVVTQTDSEDETQSKERRLSPELEERRVGALSITPLR
jgi:glycerol uptake facilitator-like aquaporin